MKIRPPHLFLLLSALLLNACISNKTQVTPIPNGITIRAKNNTVSIQFYNPKTVRVLKWTAGGTPDKLSLSVIAKPQQNLNVMMSENESTVTLSSDSLTVVVNKKTQALSYTNSKGESILSEQGQPLFNPVVFDGDSGFAVQQRFKLTPDEGIYGLGQHQYGYFNYRGKEVKLVQSNTDAVNPFLVSTKNYGILWDNYSMTIFNDNEQGASLWSDMGSNIDYFFVWGKNMDEVIGGYRTLTGKAPMYGKWAYGYWQSKEHYDTQDELMAVAMKYRQLKIPIDNMIQDWDYWNGAENWSGMFFDKTLFPTPKAMCDELHRMNFHLIISIWPALGPKTPIYADMEAHNFLYKPVGWAGFKYYDAFNPEANRLYWKYLRGGLYSKGLDGWWIDSTEPDVINALSKEATEYEMKRIGSNYLGSWARYLNAFSLVMTNDIYRYWREETSDRRAYILTRSTFAGQQRNAATTWSGDIGASWSIYRNQISAGLNHSMSGIPYWTFDIGAFVLGAYEGVFCYGGKDPAYQELYNRMFQLGVFTPIFRSHGSETPREIWEMGEFTESIITFDKLRYRLMPYIYSLAWKITSADYTLMRGLPMDFPCDKTTYTIDDQFMFGPSIMVAPVTDYMYHTPPQPSVVMAPEYFTTATGQPGLKARYYKTPDFKELSRETVDANINLNWYGGRPEYVTDSMYSIRWEGKLIPNETGKHQFHLKSFDKKRIILNGDTLKVVYQSTEQYLEPIALEAGKSYDFVYETQNNSTGASRTILNWKTPSIFAKEAEKAEREKTRDVYLPANTLWYDFWTGKTYPGEQHVTFEAPKDKIPLLVPAGSIIPMGPFIEFTTEKPADPLEIRIYPGKDGKFTLYEDENDNYNYEKGVYATIDFMWNDTKRELTITKCKGEFPGMLKERTFSAIVVSEGLGTGLSVSSLSNKKIRYTGNEIVITF
jgi:alpha-D-xyloside xylohydrolase